MQVVDGVQWEVKVHHMPDVGQVETALGDVRADNDLDLATGKLAQHRLPLLGAHLLVHHPDEPSDPHLREAVDELVRHRVRSAHRVAEDDRLARRRVAAELRSQQLDQHVQLVAPLRQEEAVGAVGRRAVQGARLQDLQLAPARVLLEDLPHGLRDARGHQRVVHPPVLGRPSDLVEDLLQVPEALREEEVGLVDRHVRDVGEGDVLLVVELE
mmetsp:Transcript_24817/g.73841  ORF Transcript_24817/g.73841 Transcript_24817/m.73841 type:complete len:213 (-) Transcript_24817:872-1510(-)